MAKVRITMEVKERLSERVGIAGLYQNSVAHYFRHRRRPRSHNGLTSSHRFEKHNTETFLNTGQAEDVCAVVFLRQSRDRDISQPMHD
jgi:hypothetical protein